ncbi:MAG: sigma factor-like helix-turn-helix DNA-binding protein [Phycisphaerales bacterium]|nr:sigma factor-like helix-turn-helix DNA-binding protein [Phycisphaerales bacterium]
MCEKQKHKPTTNKNDDDSESPSFKRVGFDPNRNVEPKPFFDQEDPCNPGQSNYQTALKIATRVGRSAGFNQEQREEYLGGCAQRFAKLAPQLNEGKFSSGDDIVNPHGVVANSVRYQRLQTIRDIAKKPKIGKLVPLEVGNGANVTKAEDILQSLCRSEESRSIQIAVEGLPSPMKEVVTKRFWDNMTYRMIADEMDISIGRTKSIFNRALKVLAQKVKRRE